MGEMQQQRDAALTPKEAAFVTGLSEKTIQQAIDRNEVNAIPALRAEGERAIGYRDLVYLRLRSGAGRLLSPEGKRRLRAELEALPSGPGEWEMVSFGPIAVNLGPDARAVRERLDAMQRARDMVISSPDILAGEPVVRGTRVSVHVLAELERQGAGRRELLEDYPSLTPESLEAALLYARMYPRRGRPRSGQWTNGAVIRPGRASLEPE